VLVAKRGKLCNKEMSGLFDTGKSLGACECQRCMELVLIKKTSVA